MRFFIPSILFLFLVSCASQQPQIIKSSSPIFIPKPPKVIAVEKEGIDKNKYPNTTWVGKPAIVDPDPKGNGLSFQAPKDGAVIWSYKDWQILDYGLTEWTKYGQALKDIVQDHNQRLMGKDEAEDKSKWKFWK